MLDVEASLYPEQEVKSEGGKGQMPTETRALERALSSLTSGQMISLKGGFKKRLSSRADCSKAVPDMALVLFSTLSRWSSPGILTCAWFADQTLLPLLIQTLRSASPCFLFLIAPGCFCLEIH